MEAWERALRERLAGLDRQGLEDAVVRLIAADPALEGVVRLQVAPTVAEVDLEEVRRAVREALGNGRRWLAPEHEELALVNHWVSAGQEAVRKGRGSIGVAVLRTVMEAVVELLPGMKDSFGTLSDVVEDCVVGLVAALDADPEGEAGARALDALVQLVVQDRAVGGFGLHEGALEALREPGRAAHRPAVVHGLVEALRARQDLTWVEGRRHLARLALELGGASLSAEERAELVARGELVSLHLEDLIRDGDVEGAARLVARARQRDLLDLAEQLASAGHAEAARGAVRGHPAVLDLGSHRIRGWLEARGVPLPENQERLMAAVHRVNVQKTVRAAKALQAEAEAVGRWPELVCCIGPLDQGLKKVQPLRAWLAATRGDVEVALEELAG